MVQGESVDLPKWGGDDNMVDGWKYSNYGLISTAPPHKDAQIDKLGNWQNNGVGGGTPPIYTVYERF